MDLHPSWARRQIAYRKAIDAECIMWRVVSASLLRALLIALSIRGLRRVYTSMPSSTRHTIMSQPLASVSMPQAPGPETTSSSDIKHTFETALKLYKKKTKKNLKDHDLFKELGGCDTPGDILAKFQAAQFDDPSQTESDDRLKRWLVPTLNVLCAFSDTLDEGVSSVMIDSFVPP